MKILMISSVFPLPANNGAKIRILNSIKNLSKDNELVFVSLLHDKARYQKEIREIEKYCLEVHTVDYIQKSKLHLLLKYVFSQNPYRVTKFFNKEIKQVIKQEILGTSIKLDFDVIYVQFMNSLVYIDKEWISDESIVAVDEHNCDELYWESYARSTNFVYKLIGKENIRRLGKYRIKMNDIINIVLSVSKNDADSTSSLFNGIKKVSVIPNGVDIKYFSSRNTQYEQKENNIILCGSMDATMNHEAAMYLINDIFPMVKDKIKDVKLYIVGRNPSKSLLDYNSEDIIVTGTVDDVRPYYDKAKVSVAPYKYGGGTKLKNLEAMSMKVPIVSTEVGIQGINASNGNNVIIRDTDEKFADAIIVLLTNKEKWESLSREAFNFVKDNYSWEAKFKECSLALKEELRSHERNCNS